MIRICWIRIRNLAYSNGNQMGMNDAYPYTTVYPTLLYIFFADNNFNAFRVQATTADGRLRFKRYCDRYPSV